MPNKTPDSDLDLNIDCGHFDFHLEDHADNFARLQKTMSRVQTLLSPPDFIRTVSKVFQREQMALSSQEQVRFREQSAFQVFLDVLHATMKDREKPISVAVLGCGVGFAGVGPGFAATVVKEAISARDIVSIAEIEITPELLSSETRLRSVLTAVNSPVDLVVSFSFLHYIPCLSPLFWFIDRLVSPAGGFIMAHEPNARYWRNPVLQEAFSRFQQSKKLGRRLRALRSRLLGHHSKTSGDKANPLAAVVNACLRREFAFKDDLRESEIARIVDVHRPEAFRSGFRIGWDGFDIDALQLSYLGKFKLADEFTVGHLGYNDSRSLPPRWRKIESQLANAYPRDGCVVSAHCRRK